jgi:uncharacterized protein (DUF58 family)
MSRSPRQAEQLLTRLEWTVIRRLDGLLQGDYRTLFRGTGLDFADLREYQLHDDVRHIDWNVTARTQVPHVRVYTEERDLTAWFLVDLSPSVDFGSGERDKRQLLIEFVAVMARLFAHRGNKVGALLFDGVSELIVPARAGRRHVVYLLDKLLTHPRRLRAPPTDLAAFLRRAASAISRRSAVFVISDFVSVPGWDRPLALLNGRHDTVAVRVTDPLERALPDLGLLPFEDAESGEQVFVDTSDPAFRHRFATVAAAFESELASAFEGAGADALELATGEHLLDAILHFAQMRQGRRARAGDVGEAA